MTSPGKFLISATFAAGTIFATLAAPIAYFGSQPIEVAMSKEKILEGSVKDLAAPYLAIAGLLSLGTSVAGMSLLGWRDAARRSRSLAKQLDTLEQQLHAKESQLQAARLSDRYLQQNGLQFFLDDAQPIEQLQSHQTANQNAAVAVRETPAPRIPVIKSTLPTLQPMELPQPSKAQAQPLFPSHAAQAFLSFSRSSAQTVKQTAVSTTRAERMQVELLHSQLQQILTQIETLQHSLQANPGAPVVTPTPAIPVGTLQSAEVTLAALNERLHAIDPSKATYQVAS